MIKYLGTSTQPLTEVIAAEFATMPSHRGERPLRRSHVAWLEQKIKSGLFHAPRWAKATLGDKTYRVNGQHSSTALAQANGKFPSGLMVVIDQFACDTDSDIADLFAQFDPKQGARTEQEIIMATARQHDDLIQLKSTPLE